MDTSIREALDGLVEALRKYVVQATAMVRKNDPKTAELSGMLLAPIIEWETPSPTPGGPSGDGEGQSTSGGQRGQGGPLPEE